MRRGELFDLWPEWDRGADRRSAAALRTELYVGNYAPRVQALVRKRVQDPIAGESIARVVNTAHGLLGSVTDAVAVAYQRGVRRELRGASPDLARAFADLVAESAMVERATSLSALAWATGPVLLVPWVGAVRGAPRLSLAVMLPGTYEVRCSPVAPDAIEAVLWRRDDGAFVEVDALGWRYWSSAGDPLNDGAYTPHGLDYCPAVALRARPWLPFDWHNARDHAGLVDATLEVSFRHALALWLRQQVAVPQVVITAPVAAVPADQAMGHPTVPLWFNAQPGEVRYEVHERKVNVAEMLAEIAAIVNAAVSRYGIPPSEITYTNDATNYGSLSVAVRGERLAAQRDAQAPWLKSSELALWRAVVDVARASTHRHALALPPADEAAAALRVMFPDLASPDEQIKRFEAFEAAQRHGLANAVDLLLQSRPEFTRLEAEEEIAANLDQYAQRLEWLASRNVSMDPARGVQSIAQLQGRAGGVASGEARAGAAYAAAGDTAP